MTETIKAPWTPEQVVALNRFQREGNMHPFTCPDHGDPRDLVAGPDGWVCPQFCGYTQDRAHCFMADPNLWPPSIFDLMP